MFTALLCLEVHLATTLQVTAPQNSQEKKNKLFPEVFQIGSFTSNLNEDANLLDGASDI